MQNGSSRVIDGLKAKTVTQSMLEGGAEASLCHDAACCAICFTCRSTVADDLQSGILRCNTRFVCFAPFITDGASEEGAGQLCPVTVDANLHLNRDGITMCDGSVGSQVECFIGHGCTRASHHMHMRQDVIGSRRGIASA